VKYALVAIFAGTVAFAPAAAQAPAGEPVTGSPAHVTPPDTGIVRGLYVNRFAAQSTKRIHQLIAIADSSEINALVIDIKDEFGLNYAPTDPAMQKTAGRPGVIPNLRQLLDTLRAHNILAVARIVVFKDSVTARVHPDWTIRNADGTAWHDKKGMVWVNPYHHELWEYNIHVAEDAVRLGFGEVQFDYIRFPEPYKSLAPQVFPDQNGQNKEQALADFLSTARARLAKLGVRTTADIFGLVTSVPNALEVGQQWEHLAPVTDVLLPMVYPSHYPAGSLDVAHPNAEPYAIVYAAILRAHERDAKLGLSGERVRPWLQAFTLGKPPYGPDELREQERAVYDAGYDGWVLWNARSKCERFARTFERTRVSHRKPFAAPAPNSATSRKSTTTKKSRTTELR
jgi:hypothetical protein